MNRATAVYIIMLAVAVAGMWVILALGDTLTAPTDLAGQWELLPPGEKVSAVEKAAASTVDPMAAGKSPMMAIEQSGRFFQVSFDDGTRLDLMLRRDADASASAAAQRAMELHGGHWDMRVGLLASDVVDVTLSGPRSGHWTARRLMRTFAGGSGGMASGTAGAGERGVSGTRE